MEVLAKNGGSASPVPRSRADEIAPDLPPTRRRLAHRQAAETAGGDAVWFHRVAAASHADESLASALESAALGSGPAGPGRPGPALLMEWAADLSMSSAARERRVLAAALQCLYAGRLTSSRLWVHAEACPPSALRSCALAGRALLQGCRIEAEFHLGRAVAQAGPYDEVTAIICGIRAALHSGLAHGRQAAAEAAAGLAVESGDRGLRRWLVRLLAEGRCYAEDPRAAVDTLESSGFAGTPRPAGGTQAEPATVLAFGSYLALSGEPHRAIAILRGLADSDDSLLAPDLEAGISQWLGLTSHLIGAWRQADAYASAALQMTSLPGTPDSGVPHAICALLAARRGNWSTAQEHLRCARDLALANSPDGAVLCDIASAAIAHARGLLPADERALDQLATGSGAARKYRSLWLPMHAEALIERGSEQEATAALAALRALADRVPYVRVACCRLAGRLAERRKDPLTAQQYYESAIELPPECLIVPVEVGLLEHCYGRLLSGLGATSEGLRWLDSARTRLLSAGAMPYAERCAADLASRQRAADSGSELSVLTQRERAVAHLVSAGLTNQEVAARLYVSVKTVEYHLARVYSKLGISSRRQLARVPGKAAG
ncbi:MAG TPA: helix-turn-helix transcriptional regulator [Streptosporangiaceae bacterium]|nr:helix-turn-helix transcriptional regulator [Streptosporangiaceae bacterium]